MSRNTTVVLICPPLTHTHTHARAFLLRYGLCDDNIGNFDYVRSNGMMISKQCV
jgi:hypothetical protein